MVKIMKVALDMVKKHPKKVAALLAGALSLVGVHASPELAAMVGDVLHALGGVADNMAVPAEAPVVQ